MQGEVALPGTDVAGRRAEQTPGPPARGRRGTQLPYLLLAPTVGFLVLFFAWPMVQSLALAVQDQDDFSLAPLQRMVSDLAFWDAIRTTLLLTLVVVPAQVVLA